MKDEKISLFLLLLSLPPNVVSLTFISVELVTFIFIHIFLHKYVYTYHEYINVNTECFP